MKVIYSVVILQLFSVTMAIYQDCVPSSIEASLNCDAHMRDDLIQYWDGKVEENIEVKKTTHSNDYFGKKNLFNVSSTYPDLRAFLVIQWVSHMILMK